MSPDQVQEPHPYLIFIGDGNQRKTLEERAGTMHLEFDKISGIQKSDRTSRIL